jgi:hypothetical protein
MQICGVDGKIYMAIYVGGDLMEYDPAKPARYPENPRVVASPHDTLRPLAILNVGSKIYYPSSALYGQLGCILTRYDVKTGVAAYAHDPLPALAIRSLFHDAKAKKLIVGTGIHADCQSAPATAKSAAIAVIDPDTLKSVKSASLPAGIELVSVVAPMGGGRYACIAKMGSGKPRGLFEVSINSLVIPPQNKWREFPEWGAIYPTRTPGTIIYGSSEGLHLFDLRTLKKTRQIAGKETAHKHCHFHGDDILYNDATTVYVLEGALRGV